MDNLQDWTNHLLDALEYTDRRPIEMAAAADGASRWRAINPTTSPTDTDEHVLPGLYIAKTKDVTPAIKVRESVLRELHLALNQKLGTTGITLFSVQTDLDLVMVDAFRQGVEALGSEIEPQVMGGVPLTTVEHDNLQLTWNRSSRARPDIKVPDCINADEDPTVYMPCYAVKLVGNQGPLPMWLSPSQQLVFDDSGELPPRCPCLLCIRSALQELVLAYGKDINPMRMATRRLVNPPFKVLVDQPGGYRSEHCVTAADSQVVSTPFPRNSGMYAVRCNEKGDQWYVDQQTMVYNVQPEALN